MQKLRIGVLMGGRSQEREVSLNSGRTICDHVDTSCYVVIPLFQTSDGALYVMPSTFLHRGKISDFEHRLATEAQKISWHELKDIVDIVYIAQHGRFAEDGSLQGLFETIGIPYVGSKVLASALGMDKAMQCIFLKTAGINVPKRVVVPPKKAGDGIAQGNLWPGFAFPCVVKPSGEGSSLGVSVVYDIEELIDAIKRACTITPGIEQAVIIEEYIQGMEFSCIVLTDYKAGELLPLPPTEIILNQGMLYFDYEQKYMPGKAIKHTPARCSMEQQKKIQETCISVMRILGIHNIARIDGFLTADDRVIIIDPNTFSGMDPASFAFVQAAELNMGHTHLINHLIETELHAYGMLTNYAERNGEMNRVAEKKLRVGVLLGGASNEREISLASGRNVMYKLSPHKYEPIALFVSSARQLYKIDQRLLVRNTTAEIEASLEVGMHIPWSELPDHIDFAFNGLHGGHGENGCVQGTLETLALPYNGSSVLASALCMDKFKTTQLLREKHIAVPQAQLITRKMWESTSFAPVSCYPCIIKPNDDGCSVLVQKAYSNEELRAALGLIFASGKHEALVEEFITGMELTVGVIGNTHSYALLPSMSVAQNSILSIQEKFLPGAGENQTPAPLAPAAIRLVQRTMENAYSAVGCKGYARIDCFYQPSAISPTGQDRVVILEINTLPALTPATCLFHQAAEVGLRPMEFIDLLVQLGLEEHSSPLLASKPEIVIDTLVQHRNA